MPLHTLTTQGESKGAVGLAIWLRDLFLLIKDWGRGRRGFAGVAMVLCIMISITEEREVQKCGKSEESV